MGTLRGYDVRKKEKKDERKMRERMRRYGYVIAMITDHDFSLVGIVSTYRSSSTLYSTKRPRANRMARK